MLEETRYPFVEHPRSVVENPQSTSQNMNLQTYYSYTQGFDQQKWIDGWIFHLYHSPVPTLSQKNAPALCCRMKR